MGWHGSELVGDLANVYRYAQRTADGRIAIGGRGIPYRCGSRTDRDGITQAWTIESLQVILHSQFPVTLDRGTGLGSAGGYVGSGLTATNLAGRTLADLVLGNDYDLTDLPWTGRRARRWEPEPLTGR